MKKIYLFPGQFAAVNEPAEITTVLGSCVGVAIFDSIAKVGGLNHYLLPYPIVGEKPSPRYGEIAVPQLIESLINLGGNQRNFQARVFGGANVLEGVKIGVGIGNENIALALRLLEEARIPILEKNVGGDLGRHIVFSTQTFLVSHRFNARSAA